MKSALRRLYFLRHGRADRMAFTGNDDRLRPLTPEGILRLEAAAAKLAQLEMNCEVILTSPLTRCRQTADIVAPVLGLSGQVKVAPELACGFDLGGLEDLLAQEASCRAALLVGHEPDFSEVVSRLTGGSHILFKKGGLARVDLWRDFPAPQGVLAWLLPPKVLAL